MKKIIIEDINQKTINLWAVSDRTPIFAKRDGKLVGMVVLESAGWILRLGGERAHSGYYKTKGSCLRHCMLDRYTFFIED